MGRLKKDTWVKCKQNGIKRYVTAYNTVETFIDDGEVSGQPASNHCYYENYEPVED